MQAYTPTAYHMHFARRIVRGRAFLDLIHQLQPFDVQIMDTDIFRYNSLLENIDRNIVH